ncbi:hypothetical protein RJ640_028516 [Escallonia rubra]|uniref:Protein kinase domain-containing protein n=1 Tax=Escallonia rubra TaxID=112253 RepID=A0AA88QPF5_9ASTE|nr:hypothetical protein RJ640_028516 [Escallonia rubra]
MLAAQATWTFAEFWRHMVELIRDIEYDFIRVAALDSFKWPRCFPTLLPRELVIRGVSLAVLSHVRTHKNENLIAEVLLYFPCGNLVCHKRPISPPLLLSHYQMLAAQATRTFVEFWRHMVELIRCNIFLTCIIFCRRRVLLGFSDIEYNFIRVADFDSPKFNCKDHLSFKWPTYGLKNSSWTDVQFKWILQGYLYDILKKKRRLDPVTAIAYASDIVRYSLHIASPRNVLQDEAGHLKVTDFGSSKIAQEKDAYGYKLAGGTGSYRYMAPEVYRHESYGKSVDVFSFSLLVHEYLTMVVLHMFQEGPSNLEGPPEQVADKRAYEDSRPYLPSFVYSEPITKFPKGSICMYGNITKDIEAS